MLPRRKFLHLAAGAAALPPLTRFAAAQDAYPSRPIHVVIGFTPGAAADVVARVLSQAAGADPRPAARRRKQAGRRVEHRRRICRACAKDGYTLFLGTLSIITNQIINPNNALDLTRDFEPVALVQNAPIILVVNPKSNIHSVKELDCAVQGEAGTGARFERHRQHAAFRQRAVRAAGRHQAHTSALSGQPAGGRRTSSPGAR